MKAQTSSNEYYKHYSVTDKEFRSFEAGLTNKLKAFMTIISKQKRMKPSQFWGQQDCSLGKSLIFRNKQSENDVREHCLLYTSPSPRDLSTSRMPSSA